MIQVPARRGVVNHSKQDPGVPEKPGRQWGRSAQTRAAILEAARTEFLEHGYTDAGIAHVVERSGCSVGSIYHHFGGKAELFLALWESHQRDYTEAANEAVADGRRNGEHDPLELFVAGARAYLEMAWTNSRMARLFLAGDGPPGFDTLQRQRGRSWFRQNGALLRAPDDPVGRVLVMVLTSIVGDGAREVSSLDSQREADELIEATLGFVRKVAT
jgi:AcrR family transcriptional regulator